MAVHYNYIVDWTLVQPCHCKLSIVFFVCSFEGSVVGCFSLHVLVIVSFFFTPIHYFTIQSCDHRCMDMVNTFPGGFHTCMGLGSRELVLHFFLG